MVVKTLINIEKKLYYPGEVLKGLIYLRIRGSAQLSKLTLQVTGIEEVRFSKYVDQSSVYAIDYLKSNPVARPTENGKVLIDEYEISKYICHQELIYSLQKVLDANERLRERLLKEREVQKHQKLKKELEESVAEFVKNQGRKEGREVGNYSKGTPGAVGNDLKSEKSQKSVSESKKLKPTENPKNSKKPNSSEKESHNSPQKAQKGPQKTKESLKKPEIHQKSQPSPKTPEALEIDLPPIKRYSEGDYVFPFALELPSRLPGTFRKYWVIQDRVNYGSCEFKAKVSIEMTNHKSYHDEQEFLVQGRFKADKETLNQQIQITPAKFCCFSRTPFQVCLKALRPGFSFGRTVSVVLGVDNPEAKRKVRKHIKQVKGCLIRVITIRTAGGRFKRFVKQYSRQKLTPKFEEVEEPKEAQNDPKTQPEASKPLKTEEFCRFEVNVPTQINSKYPSYNGNYVNCDYYFHVYIKTYSGTTAKFPYHSKIKLVMKQDRSRVLARRFKPSADWSPASDPEPLTIMRVNKHFNENLIPSPSLEQRKARKKKLKDMDLIVTMYGFRHYEAELRRRVLNSAENKFEILGRAEEIPDAGMGGEDLFGPQGYFPMVEEEEDELSVEEKSEVVLMGPDAGLEDIEINSSVYHVYPADNDEYKEVVLDKEAYVMNPYLPQIIGGKKGKGSAKKKILKILKIDDSNPLNLLIETSGRSKKVRFRAKNGDSRILKTTKKFKSLRQLETRRKSSRRSKRGFGSPAASVRSNGSFRSIPEAQNAAEILRRKRLPPPRIEVDEVQSRLQRRKNIDRVLSKLRKYAFEIVEARRKKRQRSMSAKLKRMILSAKRHSNWVKEIPEFDGEEMHNSYF